MKTAINTAVRAEWTKLRTTPGPAWLLLATVTVTAGLSAAITAAALSPDENLALSGLYLGQVPIAVLAVLCISGEYSTTLIRTTLTAIPDRRTILTAKALALTLPVAATGTLSVLACRCIAPIDPRAAAGTVAYLVLIAILSLGVAAMIRDSATSIGTVLGLLYLPPILAPAVANPHLHHLLDKAAPMTALHTGALHTGTGPHHQLAGLGVLATWSAAALLAGTLLLRYRDT
jgi:ABC-2 type transport system permease protein